MRLIAVSGAVLALISSVLYFVKKDVVTRTAANQAECLVASAGNTYFGPKTKVPGNPQLVRIEIVLKDSQDDSGPQLVSAEFYNRNIPLKPRDIYGNRGSASFQVPPGKYKLTWTTNRDKYVWPRQENHEEEVTVSPRDLWLQIEIKGAEAQIN